MVSKNGSQVIEIIRYEDRYHEQAMEVLRKSFFLHETVCIGTEVNLTPQAQKDLEQLCHDVADDGVSMIAKHVPTGTVVGVSFNVLQTPRNPDNRSYFERFRDSKCTTDSSRELLQYMIAMDAKVNLFERYNISCLLEIMYLSTLPNYAGYGIATLLVEQSVRLAEKLKNATEVAIFNHTNSHLTQLRNPKRPQIVSALFSSKISQRIGEKVGFTFVMEVQHSEFVFKDKTFAERVPDHPSSKIAVKFI